MPSPLTPLPRAGEGKLKEKDFMNTKLKTRIAREFRKKPTQSEKLMWDVLRNRSFMNLKFRHQHGMEGYVIDFYCSELHLAVEIDGGIHDEQIDDDAHRQQAIEQSGVIFFRIKSENVESGINNVLDEITKFITNLNKFPSIKA